MTPTVAIVGGGASGTLLAAQLLRRLHPTGLRVTVIERRDRIGPGLAYSTPYEFHRLNVPAGQMGALPRDPEHFLRWARRRRPELQGSSFVPRSLYGEYLAEVLRDAERSAIAGVGLERVHDEAIGVEIDPVSVMPRSNADSRPAVAVRLGSGETLRADCLVLALGNPPPAPPAGVEPELLDGGRFHVDPWDPAIAERSAGERSALLIGTGLTMVDVALVLAAEGGPRSIEAVSRNGLLPREHLITGRRPERTFPLPRQEFSLDQLVGRVEREIEEVEAAGGDWRAVIDSLRPVTNRIWRRLPDDDRDRFIREVSRHWEIRRHRMAPTVAAMLSRLQVGGRLRVGRGAIESVFGDGDRVAVRLRDRSGSTRTSTFDRVVNCTGPSLELDKLGEPILESLLRAGEVRSGPFGLGLDHDSRGAMVREDGSLSALVYGIGPVRKGRLWETTAIPEIRAQALELADLLTAAVARRPAGGAGLAVAS